MSNRVIGPTSRQARAVLSHPDRRTEWMIVVGATARRPLVGLEERLETLSDVMPVAAARLDGDMWVEGAPPRPSEVEGDAVNAIAATGAFALAREPPLRLVVSADRRHFALGLHHAAFDGLAAVAIAGFVSGGPAPRPGPDARSQGRGSLVPVARRLLFPADRVARSAGADSGEVLASRVVDVAGPDVTARIAAAAADAAASHNRERIAPWRRIGISIGIGGPHAGANVASYRRVDVGVHEDVRAAVAAALRIQGEPAELVAPSRALQLVRPLVARLSDSFLVSNVGRHDLEGLERVSFYPVARGRSAIAFGAAGLEGGPSTITVRARDLDGADANALLDGVVARLQES